MSVNDSVAASRTPSRSRSTNGSPASYAPFPFVSKNGSATSRRPLPFASTYASGSDGALANGPYASSAPSPFASTPPGRRSTRSDEPAPAFTEPVTSMPGISIVIGHESSHVPLPFQSWNGSEASRTPFLLRSFHGSRSVISGSALGNSVL